MGEEAVTAPGGCGSRGGFVLQVGCEKPEELLKGGGGDRSAAKVPRNMQVCGNGRCDPGR